MYNFEIIDPDNGETIKFTLEEVLADVGFDTPGPKTCRIRTLVLFNKVGVVNV